MLTCHIKKPAFSSGLANGCLLTEGLVSITFFAIAFQLSCKYNQITILLVTIGKTNYLFFLVRNFFKFPTEEEIATFRTIKNNLFRWATNKAGRAWERAKSEYIGCYITPDFINGKNYKTAIKEFEAFKENGKICASSTQWFSCSNQLANGPIHRPG
jgi:hypothetical protein